METSTFMIISIVAMFVMAIAVILFVVKYQHNIIRHHVELREIHAQKELEILTASIQGEEEERKRIASELHDDIGATLSSAKLFLDATNGEINIERLATSRSLIDESLERMRSISYKLQPASLITLGLHSAIKRIIHLLDKSGKLSSSLVVSENFPRLESYTELHIYRILQEVITNITKHSKAKRLDIDMRAESHLNIKISHDGEGLTDQRFDELKNRSTGSGLANITNRLRILKGGITFYKESNNYYVLITIPLSDETREN